MPRLHAIGPLSSEDQPYHVHAEGCGDVERSPAYRGRQFQDDRTNAYDFDSKADVAEFLFADVDDNPRELTGDIKVFACAGALPEGA
jgi:hypothetical protein